MRQKFKDSGRRYQCIGDEHGNINLFFKIYDRDMNEKGVCITQINREAVDRILTVAAKYSDSAWAVVFGGNYVVASYGEQSYVERLVGLENVWNGNKALSGKHIIGWADTYAFSIRTVIAVGRENVFFMMKPMLLLFGAGLLAVFVITAFLAYIVSSRFTRPITRMTESIAAFGKQDFDVRMEDSNISELHDISVVFNEMADKIKYLIKQVYEKQILAAQAQLKYLQAQINPHFQFNILAMLSLKAKLAGNEEVYEGLHAFSKLIQGKIFNGKEIKIRVSEELKIVSFYLYLQKSRYQDKLSYEIIVDGEEINHDLIPRLLIEPLVENAVSHGLEPKRDKGTIKVQLHEEKAQNSGDKAMLHISVEDDGIGFELKDDTHTDTDIEAEEIGHTRTGLRNMKRLLQILYGASYKFEINSKKGKGTRIEIVLPAERGENDVESSSGR